MHCIPGIQSLYNGDKIRSGRRAAAKSWESECAMQIANQKVQNANTDNTNFRFKNAYVCYKIQIQMTKVQKS